MLLNQYGNKDSQGYRRQDVVWGVNSSHSIIAEYCKGKQTYPPSHSLRNQTLRHIHSIGYNNIYSLTLCGKEIALYKLYE